MKITIKGDGHHSLHIIIPTWIVSSPTLISLSLRIARKKCPHVPYISRNTLKMLRSSIKETKRRYRHYELVNIESNDGDLVKIVL